MEERKNKWIGVVSKIIVLVLVFFIGFSVGVNYTNDRVEISETELREGAVSLSLDFGDGQVEDFEEIEVSGGESVFNVLESSEVEMEYRDFGGDMGIFLESIEGVGQSPEDQGKWWQFWVNGEYSQAGVSSVVVSSEDEIYFRFTDEHFE